MKYKNLCISEYTTIRDAINILDKINKKILIVVECKKLKAIITDKDIRMWILKSGDLDKYVSEIMNGDVIYLKQNQKNKAKKVMKKNAIESIPIVNEYHEIVDIVFWNDEFEEKLNHYGKIKAPVVIMAGGQGTRLLPYTKILPKPLIPIGDTPIVERIIDRFIEYGCDDFYLTVNYKKSMIKSYFNEKEKNYNISYVEEEKPLGTGGSLHILKEKLKETFFVSNCDILIDTNYSEILKYHKENNNKITVVSSLKNYKIPYGIIKLSKSGEIAKTEEKPEYNFLVNTGMYVLEPEVLDDIPENKFFHITNLIDKYLERGEKVGTYPVTDNAWLDMGEFGEMKKMIGILGV